MTLGNRIKTNRYEDYTTIILEIEDNIHSPDIPKVRAELQAIGTIVSENSLHTIDKHDSDLHYGWKFVARSDQSNNTIERAISNIASILSGDLTTV